MRKLVRAVGGIKEVGLLDRRIDAIYGLNSRRLGSQQKLFGKHSASTAANTTGAVRNLQHFRFDDFGVIVVRTGNTVGGVLQEDSFQLPGRPPFLMPTISDGTVVEINNSALPNTNPIVFDPSSGVTVATDANSLPPTPDAPPPVGGNNAPPDTGRAVYTVEWPPDQLDLWVADPITLTFNAKREIMEVHMGTPTYRSSVITDDKLSLFFGPLNHRQSGTHRETEEYDADMSIAGPSGGWQVVTVEVTPKTYEGEVELVVGDQVHTWRWKINHEEEVSITLQVYRNKKITMMEGYVFDNVGNPHYSTSFEANEAELIALCHAAWEEEVTTIPAAGWISIPAPITAKKFKHDYIGGTWFVYQRKSERALYIGGEWVWFGPYYNGRAQSGASATLGFAAIRFNGTGTHVPDSAVTPVYFLDGITPKYVTVVTKAVTYEEAHTEWTKLSKDLDLSMYASAVVETYSEVGPPYPEKVWKWEIKDGVYGNPKLDIEEEFLLPDWAVEDDEVTLVTKITLIWDLF